MISIVNMLNRKEAFVSLKGATENEIVAAEIALGVKFAQEYNEYVTAFGAASYYGHELTGVCNAQASDVVRITLSEREYADVPQDWYVIEQTHIDGIVFWQAADGIIYKSQEKKKCEKIFDSLHEYIDMS